MQRIKPLTTCHLASGLSELETAAFGPLSRYLQTASGGWGFGSWGGVACCMCSSKKKTQEHVC